MGGNVNVLDSRKYSGLRRRRQLDQFGVCWGG